MQRRVAEGRPEVKDAFTDFEKLGHRSPRSRARVFFFFFFKVDAARNGERIREGMMNLCHVRGLLTLFHAQIMVYFSWIMEEAFSATV